MAELEKIDQEIAAPGADGLTRRAIWLADFQAEARDRQLEGDLRDGWLDSFLEEARKEVATGKVRPLRGTSIWIGNHEYCERILRKR